jgi:hypothetical protein
MRPLPQPRGAIVWACSPLCSPDTLPQARERS